MFSFEDACEKMYDNCRLWGYPGIGSICDVGNEWGFLPAPQVKGERLPMGELPYFVSKDTGEIQTGLFERGIAVAGSSKNDPYCS